MCDICHNIERIEEHNETLQTQVSNLTQAVTLSKGAVEAMQSANDKLSGELERLQKENEGLKKLAFLLNRSAINFQDGKTHDNACKLWVKLMIGYKSNLGEENETN